MRVDRHVPVPVACSEGRPPCRPRRAAGHSRPPQSRRRRDLEIPPYIKAFV